MKKKISLAVIVALIAALGLLGTVASAAPQDVNLSSGGSLSVALNEVADGGTIHVDGTVAVTENPRSHGKAVTITGGELDFSGISGDVTLGDHITFDDITLTFANNAAVFANGNRVKMGEGVTMTNPIRLFGGKRGAAVESTHLTLLAGKYYQIFGGGNNGDVTGDTYLYVGGNVNPDADATSHSATYCVYGGGYIHEGATATIGGNAYTVFADNAKANYVFGGNNGAGTGIIKGSTDLTVSGGATMSVYGGSRGSSLTGNTKVLISGGTMEQVFGGCESHSMTGDVTIDITGGTITRRIYGGCYNEATRSGLSINWGSSHYVTGKVMLTLHGGANITLNDSDDDRAIFAHSRQKTLSATEVTHLVYADSTAYNTYKNKVGAQDMGAMVIMGSTAAADHIHYHTYSASGAVITQNCIDKSCSASATVAAEGKHFFNGAAVEPAKVIYAGDWFGGELDITYANNTGVGTATASITCGGATASASFTIAAPGMTMNGKTYQALEDAIAAARTTPGADTITLYEDVELSTWLLVDTDVTIVADTAVTITAADAQTGSMIRIIGGTFAIEGASEDAKITLAAGKNTANIISNNGGDVVLTNVQLTGNKNTTHNRNNKACGIFNYEGTTTAKRVVITDTVMGDGIFVMKGTEVNLDDVTIAGCGRYGIQVLGTLNVSNTTSSDHALTVSDTGSYAINVENGGKVNCGFTDGDAIKLIGKGLKVRAGGSAELP